MAIKKPKRGIDLGSPIVKATGRKRSQKFQQFLEELTMQRLSSKTKNEYAAAKSAGYSESAARNPKGKIWKKKQAQEIWDDIIASTVDPQMIQRNILLGLNATKVSYIGRDGRPEVDIDIAERREWTKLVRRWSGINDAMKVDQSGNQGTVINFINDMD